MENIKIGSIVSYQGGNYRVSNLSKTKVNLASVFGNHIYHKGVSLNEVRENSIAFYAAWEKSESYLSM